MWKCSIHLSAYLYYTYFSEKIHWQYLQNVLSKLSVGLNHTALNMLTICMKYRKAHLKSQEIFKICSWEELHSNDNIYYFYSLWMKLQKDGLGYWSFGKAYSKWCWRNEESQKKEAPEPVILPEMVLQVYFEVSTSLSLRYSARL